MKKALTEEQAENARLLRAKGYSFPEIARKMNVSDTTVATAINRAGAYRGGKISMPKVGK
jgi:predicted DNA-binding protein YlxM (UPF0122 family)